MTEWLYFLGRFHVLLLHLPIGILLLAAVLEVISRRPRFQHLAPALDIVWLLGAVTAVGAALLGYLHASEGGFDSSVVGAHRFAGTSLAVLATAIALTRARFATFYLKVWPVCVFAIVALLFVTGHFGGELTHGETYLAQYAPVQLQHLMGVPDEKLFRPRPADLASAELYLDVVAPAFRQRCGSCHNDGKKKGGLSLATFGALMKGGKHGPVIVPGEPERSDLVRRISLPHDDADFMPQDGKTPLSPEQAASIQWWVRVGAPRSSAVLALNPTEEIRHAVEVTLGMRAPGTITAEDGPTVSIPPAGVDALDELERRGFVVRAIAAGSPYLQADYTASRRIKDDDIAALSKIGRQLHGLNLREAGVTDAQLRAVGAFENLAQLRLERNPVTDGGLVALEGLGNLEYLNLYGTRITDAGLESLGALPRLRELFLWQTAVTPSAVEQFRRAHAQVRVIQGFDAARFPEAPRVIPVVN